MHKILADTCVWLDLAKESAQRPLIETLFELEAEKRVQLLVPRIVLDEFQRNKGKVVEQNTRSLAATLKRAKDLVAEFGDRKRRAAALRQIEYVDQSLPRLGDAAVNAVGNIERLLGRGLLIETCDGVKVRAASRAIEKRAPCHRGKNSVADAVLIEIFAQCVAEPSSSGHSFAFVTHNTSDFSDPAGDRRVPHPDLASVFTKRKARYFTSLAEALRRAAPGHVPRVLDGFEFEPRRTNEILEALDLLCVAGSVNPGHLGCCRRHTGKSGRSAIPGQELASDALFG